ncbi:hypothetical protein COOONC_06406 [Cooperia oncophora]
MKKASKRASSTESESKEASKPESRESKEASKPESRPGGGSDTKHGKRKSVAKTSAETSSSRPGSRSSGAPSLSWEKKSEKSLLASRPSSAATTSESRSRSGANLSSEKKRSDGTTSASSFPSSLGSKEGRSKTREVAPDGKRVIWRDIYAEVIPKTSCLPWRRKNAPDVKVVLNQVSGYADPGQLTYIMGASGSGKTTLLNILTQRRTDGLRVYGDIAVNQ